MVILFSCTQCAFSAERRSDPGLFDYFQEVILANGTKQLKTHHAAEVAEEKEACRGSLTVSFLTPSPFAANRPGAWI